MSIRVATTVALLTTAATPALAHPPADEACAWSAAKQSGAAFERRSPSPSISPRAFFGDDIHQFNTRTPEGAAGHFTIYYTISGDHAVYGAQVDNGGFIGLPSGARGCEKVDGSGPESYSTSNGPDWVEELGCYMEFSLRTLVDQGFGGGRVPRAIGRIFVVNYDHAGTSIPLNIPLMSGDILINHTVDPERLPTLSTHELFHQMQYSYTRHLTPWWTLEGTAAWSEDIVFEDDPRYAKHINHFLAEPDMGLYKASYDAVPFWRYVSERFGPQDPDVDLSLEWMQALWTRLGEGDSGRAAVNVSLSQLGYTETMDDIFTSDFALALALKGYPLGDDALSFDENDEVGLDDVALVDGQSLSLISGTVIDPPTRTLPRYGLHYYHIIQGTSAHGAQLTLTSSTQTEMTVNIAAVAPDGRSVWRTQGRGAQVELSVPAFPTNREVYVIVATANEEGSYGLVIREGD